ncbi:MAG: phosphotransferase [Candidatus Latescibacter sp.]|nr:phosphotransferase [Candidatus Latescibacter sp.]
MTHMDFRTERIFKGPGFAETLFLGACGGTRIIRKASNPDAFPFSRTALAREIRLLLSLPEELRRCFPPVLHTNLGDQPEDSPELPACIFYDMPYYSPEDGWVTLSKHILEGGMNAGEARRVLGEIVDTAFRYFRLDERAPAADYAEKTMLTAMRESIAWAESEKDFFPLLTVENLVINGRPAPCIMELSELFQNTTRLRAILTPYRERFLHGDFFPENILFNHLTGRWILLDPVSVRGVHRGDFILDLNKMGDWLSGELPALRMGQFSVNLRGNRASLIIHSHSGDLENLHRLQLSDWYYERMADSAYAPLFAEERGWERRWIFIKAFYSFCMVPLADKTQAVARYLLALKSMAEFIEKTDGR